MKTLDEKKRDRFLFLRHIYDLKNQPGLQLFNLGDVARDLDFDRIDALTIAEYLSNEGLLQIFNDEGDIVALTHQGTVEVEAALSVPTEPTEHFLPLNVIYVGEMNNSQIMQASEGGSQSFSVDSSRIENLRRFAQLFEERSTELPFQSEDERREVEAEVSTINAQLGSPRPKSQILLTSIQSITNVLEGFSGSMLATMLIELLKH